jgi:hypothetical protein
VVVHTRMPFSYGIFLVGSAATRDSPGVCEGCVGHRQLRDGVGSPRDGWECVLFRVRALIAGLPPVV